MAEKHRQLTQAEIDKILFSQQFNMQPQSLQALQPGATGFAAPIPQNVFQKIAGGARIAGQAVNRMGTAADVAKLFPGYTGQSQVTIPTGFNFAPKQNPMGGVIPGGLQTQQVNVGQLLQAIKPADVLGISGAERAYGDIGAGRAPKPMDVVDTLALGAGGVGAVKGISKVAEATKGLPVGMSIQDVSKAPGLLEAPRSPIGFYSALEDTALNLQRNKGTGQAFLNDLQKGANVKAEEIKWTGLDEFLKNKPNVTKQEVQDYIANNRVDVQEVQSPVGESIGRQDFRQWQLPGGENYRELLLTMPAKVEDSPSMAKLRSTAADMNVSQATREAAQEQLDNIIKRKTAEGGFKSTHFDQPNILAHLRVNDRVDADGKKMLLIEEVQSDWHQAGREKGYAKDVKNEINAIQSQMDELASKRDPVTNIMLNESQWFDLAKKKDELIKQSRGVPDAPFKDNWYQLALKRAIQHAAENGYDRIGLTTGSQQASRFDLSRQVNEIVVPSVLEDGTRSVRIDPTSGTSIKLMVDKDGVVTGYGSSSNQFTGKKLNEVIGKEMADKVMKADADSRFAGLDLQVGGEGMKKYYDEIYPKFLDKYGKKWGARIGETKVNADGVQEPIRYLDVTPEMKASVSKGQPLFQAIPAIPAAGLLAPQEEQ